MPRRNRPSQNPQHARGKARPQGQHKKARSEGLAKAVRDLHRDAAWWAPDSKEAA